MPLAVATVGGTGGENGGWLWRARRSDDMAEGVVETGGTWTTGGGETGVGGGGRIGSTAPSRAGLRNLFECQLAAIGPLSASPARRAPGDCPDT
jgi:hypothetical protein